MNTIKKIILVSAISGLSASVMANPVGHPHNYSGKDKTGYEKQEKQRWSHLKQHRSRGGVYIAKGESDANGHRNNLAKNITNFKHRADKSDNARTDTSEDIASN